MQDNGHLSILLVEGKRRSEHVFAAELQRKGYQVIVSDSGGAGLICLDGNEPDVIVVNAASLRTNGLRITNRFRNRLKETPIILIVAEDEAVQDEHQANVLLRLPFTIQKLVNRLRFFKETRPRNIYQKGPFRLNTQTHLVNYGTKETHLTPRLCQLLRVLLDNADEIITREALFKEVWDTDYVEDTRTLDVHISWLRQALEENPKKPKLIKTIRSVGYQLNING